MWKGTAKKAGLSFRLEAEESLPSVMLGNMDAIRKIISNLTGNAVKYTDHGGITLRFFSEAILPESQVSSHPEAKYPPYITESSTISPPPSDRPKTLILRGSRPFLSIKIARFLHSN